MSHYFPCHSIFQIDPITLPGLCRLRIWGRSYHLRSVSFMIFFHPFNCTPVPTFMPLNMIQFLQKSSSFSFTYTINPLFCSFNSALLPQNSHQSPFVDCPFSNFPPLSSILPIFTSVLHSSIFLFSCPSLFLPLILTKFLMSIFMHTFISVVYLSLFKMFLWISNRVVEFLSLDLCQQGILDYVYVETSKFRLTE